MSREEFIAKFCRPDYDREEYARYCRSVAESEAYVSYHQQAGYEPLAVEAESGAGRPLAAGTQAQAPRPKPRLTIYRGQDGQ